MPEVSFAQWMTVGVTLLIVGPLLFALVAKLFGAGDSASNAFRFGLVAMLAIGLILLAPCAVAGRPFSNLGLVLSLAGGIPLTFMKRDPKNR